MAPLTERYNNPGAVEFHPWMSRYGATLGENGRFAQFQTPEQGYGVMSRILDTYQGKHGLNTVSGIINRWAPRNVDNNSTDEYIKSVSGALGLAPDAPLSADHRQPLMRAMANYEAGRSNLGGPMPTAQLSPQPVAAMPATILPRSTTMPENTDSPLVGLFRSSMENPLVLAGLGLYSASSQGKDIGSGLLGSVPLMQQADKMRQERERRAAVNELMNVPSMPGVNPTILGIARATGDPSLIAQDIYKGKDADLRTKHLDLSNRQLQEQIDERKAMMPLRQQQLDLQVQQLKQNSEDPIEQMIRERVRANNAGAPAPVQPAQPNPNLRPQSAPIGPPIDPNFVQAQAPVMPPQGAPQPAARPQQDMVTLPGIGKVDVDTAKAIAFNYARKGNQGAAKMIEEAIGSGLDKGARTELDKSRINLTNQYGRLGEIERQFDPAFQKVGTQLDMFFKAGSEKMFGSLPPEQKQQLERFHAYRSAAIGHFNQMLKEFSGTAVSAQEFERIKAQLPNPGTGFANGIIDGDSPSVFQAKLKEAKRSVGLAMARSNFMAANGFRGDKDALAAAMPLDAMPNVIQRRTEQLQQQFLQQGAPPEQLREMVTKQLRQDFGIGI